MKADGLQLYVSYLPYIPEIVPGVHVKSEDTDPPLFLVHERGLDTRNRVYFRDIKIADKKL